MFKILALCLASAPLFAQTNTSTTTKEQVAPAKNSRKIILNYNNITRSLQDTDSAKALRNNDGSFLPSDLDFTIQTLGARIPLDMIHNKLSLDLGIAYMESDITIIGSPRKQCAANFDACLAEEMAKRSAQRGGQTGQRPGTGRPTGTVGRPPGTTGRPSHTTATRGHSSSRSRSASLSSQLPPGMREMILSNIPNETVINATSKGMADSRVGLVFDDTYRDDHKVTYSMHVSLPTGSIEKGSVTSSGNNVYFPYSGQLGSGTYDLRPKLKYDYTLSYFNAGASTEYILRTGRNSQNYRMGNQWVSDAYVGASWRKAVGAFLKGRIRKWENTDDLRLTDIAVSSEQKNRILTDPYTEKGTRWEVLATTRLAAPLPWVGGAVIIEGGLPIYRDQDSGDVQLETEWYLNAVAVASF